MSQPSTEVIARTIVKALVERKTLQYEFDDRDDRGVYLYAAEAVSRLFNQTPLEQRLGSIKNLTPVEQAIHNTILDAAKENGFKTIEDAREAFSEYFLSAPHASREEVRAGFVLDYLTSLL